MVAPATVLKNLLLDAGNSLLKPPDSAVPFIRLLDQVESILSRVEQCPSKEVLNALAPSVKALVSDHLLRHPDIDVRVSVASCISEIIRITAPDAPYNDQQMKDVFQLIVSSLENISDNTRQSYPKRTSILDMIAKVKSCVIMLDLECDGLIVEMFQIFLRAIRDHHPDSVFSSMEKIMTVILEESDDLSELIHPILASVKKGNEAVLPISCKLGKRVLQNCATKLKPYLVHIFKHMGYCLDDYSRVVASIFYGTANDAACHVEQTETLLSKASSVKPTQSQAAEVQLVGESPNETVLVTEVVTESCSGGLHDSNRSGMDNGMPDIQIENRSLDPESSKADCTQHSDQSVVMNVRYNSEPVCSESGTTVMQVSTSEQACQGSEHEPSSLVSSKEPSLSSQAENDKGVEILNCQENHIREVSDQPFDELVDNVSQPSRNEKIDIQARLGRQPEPSSLVFSKEHPLFSQAENDEGEEILDGQENRIRKVSDQPFDEPDDNVAQPSKNEKIDIQACQGRESEPSSLVSSKEPPFFSQAGNDKGDEILDGQENHIREVSDQPFEEPVDNLSQPSKNEKIDIQACQEREPEPRSLVSSKEPPLTSQAENDKDEEILNGQENHICEVSDQPFDEPDDNVAQPSKNEKNDIQACQGRESEPSSFVSSKEPPLSSQAGNDKGAEILDGQENHIRKVSDQPFDEPIDRVTQASKNEKIDIQACQGREPEPRSLVSSKEPPITSQAENDKDEEILDRQENHIRELCDKTFDEPDDNVAQPSKNEKIDVQLPSSKPFDCEPMNVASSSPSRDIFGSLPINAGEREKIENLIEEPTPVISKKASEGARELEETLLHSRDETLIQLIDETSNGHNPEKTLLPTLRSKTGIGLSRYSDGAPPSNCRTKVLAGDSIKDKSSVKQKKGKNWRGCRQAFSKKNVAKNPAKEDDREMLDSPKSPAESGEDACKFDETPKINSKKECVPSEDIKMAPSSRSPSVSDGDACQLDQTPKTTSKRKWAHGEESLDRTPETPPKRKSARGKDIEMVPSPNSPSELYGDACQLDQILKTTPKRKRTSRKDSASKVIKFAGDLVGMKIKVWWPKDEMFYEGVVSSFDPIEKKHKVLYTDGDVEMLNLKRQRWELIHVADGEHVTACENPDSSGSTHLKKRPRTNSESSANPGKIGSSRMVRGQGDTSSKSEGPGCKLKWARQVRGKAKALNYGGKHEDDWKSYRAGSLRRSSRSVLIASKKASKSKTVDAAKPKVTRKNVKSKGKASDKVNSGKGKKVNLAETVKTEPATGKAGQTKGIGKKRRLAA